MLKPARAPVICRREVRPNKLQKQNLHRWLRTVIVIAVLNWFTPRGGVAAEKVTFEALQSQAQAALANGKRAEAMMLANQAIAAEPKNPRGYFLRAGFHEANREPARAIADYDQVIKLDLIMIANHSDKWKPGYTASMNIKYDCLKLSTIYGTPAGELVKLPGRKSRKFPRFFSHRFVFVLL